MDKLEHKTLRTSIKHSGSTEGIYDNYYEAIKKEKDIDDENQYFVEDEQDDTDEDENGNGINKGIIFWKVTSSTEATGNKISAWSTSRVLLAGISTN